MKLAEVFSAFRKIYKVLRFAWRFTPYISVFSPNTGKHRLEITQYLGTFHAVRDNWDMLAFAYNLLIKSWIYSNQPGTYL